jgi:hypothetical protein
VEEGGAYTVNDERCKEEDEGRHALGMVNLEAYVEEGGTYTVSDEYITSVTPVKVPLRYIYSGLQSHLRGMILGGIPSQCRLYPGPVQHFPTKPGPAGPMYLICPMTHLGHPRYFII